jgi:cell division protein FtsL
MASWHAAAAEAPARARPPRARPKPRPVAKPRAPRRKARKRSGVAGGLAWIIVGSVLLAGIVALNVAVLRLNIRLDHLNNQSQQLQAQNAALGAKVSEAVSSPRIQALAKARGFVPADPATTGYVDLTPRRRR